MRNFQEAFDALKGLTNYETMVRPPYGSREMNLPRTRALLGALGSPERSFPTLQVAGTKGKGTCATALAAMLGAGGHRAGLYTSPHLFHVRERIRVGGEWIGEEDFARGVERILGQVEPLRGTPRCPTFFELVTALALLQFRERGVDAAVLEVGLGGRLDATSAVRHLAAIVTHVGLDHQAVLGRTRALIAAEKAGVARRGVPLFSGVPAATAAGRVVEAAARERGAPLHVAGRDFRIRTGRPAFREGRAATALEVRPAGGRAFRAVVPLLGRELARDAGIAVATLLHPRVARRLPVGEEAMARALAGLRVPGRIEVVAERPFVVVDGAHNPDSARALARAVGEALRFRRVFLVVGGGIDKGLPGLVRDLRFPGRRRRVLFTRPASHPRAADPEELARGLRGAEAHDTLGGALERARGLADAGDLVLVAGSLYLAGEALTLLGSGGERG